MFRITKRQRTALDTHQMTTARHSAAAELRGLHPDIAKHEPKVLDTILDALVRSGMTERSMLVEATDLLLLIGKRDDPRAAEMRAIAMAILLDDRHAPEARLSWASRQSCLFEASPIDDALHT